MSIIFSLCNHDRISSSSISCAFSLFLKKPADKKKEEEQRQRYSSPVSPRIPSSNGGAATHRRLSSSELSPKSPGASGFNSEPVPSASSGKIPARSASQPEDTPPTQRRQPLVAVGSGISMKQSLSELHFTGEAISPPKATAECTLRMRPRTSTMSTENTENGRRDHLANLQLSPVEKHKRTVRQTLNFNDVFPA